jgi:nicotinamide mononucleotide transporter
MTTYIGSKLLRDWKPFERYWLIVFLTIIIAATVYFSATGTDYSSSEQIILNWLISPLSAVSGIFCVVLAAKGKELCKNKLVNFYSKFLIS